MESSGFITVLILIAIMILLSLVHFHDHDYHHHDHCQNSKLDFLSFSSVSPWMWTRLPRLPVPPRATRGRPASLDQGENPTKKMKVTKISCSMGGSKQAFSQAGLILNYFLQMLFRSRIISPGRGDGDGGRQDETSL